MTHQVNKQPCSLCGVLGETSTYWSSTSKTYKLKVECKNPMCIGNRINLKNEGRR